MHHIGNARLFYLLLIIIGSSVLGLGIHSASAETPSSDCSATPGPGVNYNDCDFTSITPPTFAGTPGSPVNLKGATFVGAQLSGVNFQYANLQTANFTRADNNNGGPGASTNTIFDYANLTRATFEYVNPDEGTLSFQGADLHYVDFKGADLSYSELTSGADITGANFASATLSGTDFTLAIMENVIFTSTTYFQNTIFNGVDFSGTKLTHLNLSNNNFDGANFLNANLTGTSLANTSLVDAIIGSSSSTVATTFQNSDLNYVDFTGAQMSADTNFAGATTVGTIFTGCTGNPICTPTTNLSPVIYFDKILITGGSSLVQVNSTAWKIGAATNSGTHVQYTGVYATVGTTTIQQGSNLVCTPNNTIFPLGTTQVTCTATDPSNPANTSISHFYIIITDTIPPSISTPTSVVAEATGPNGAMVTYHVTANDPVDGDVTSKLVCTPASGSQFVLGSTTVTCHVTDSAGNTATQSFPVIVQDTTPPTITAANPQFQEATSSAGANIFYHATAFDLVSGNIPLTGSNALNYCTPVNGTQEALGSTTSVTCHATDAAGNAAQVTFSVTVHDTTPPKIVFSQSVITMAATGTLTQVNLAGTATAVDTVDPNPTVTNNAPSAGYPIGTTIVTWTATDHSGNKATATQTVVILPQNTPGKVNGAGSIGNGISFNMNVMSSDGLTFKGHLDYNDKSAKIDLDSVTITSLFVDSTGTKANFTGTATLNGKSGYTFNAYVIDNGNPGKNDFFQITIFDSTGHIVYTNNGKLTHGNLHVSNQADGNNNNKCDSDPRDYSNSNSYPSNNDYWNPSHWNNNHWDNHQGNNFNNGH